MLGGDPDSTFSEVRFKIYVQKGTLAKSTADFYAYFDEKKYPYKPPRVYMTKFDTSDQNDKQAHINKIVKHLDQH